MGQERRAAGKSSPWKGAALGVAIERPEHAYGLANRLQRRLPHADLSAADLYPVLYRLAEQGLVEGTPELRPGRRPRVVYRATEAGIAEFERWLRRSAPLSARRSELLVKIAVARPDDRGDLEALLDQLQQAHRDLLEAMRELEEEEGALPAGSWARVVQETERDDAAAHWQADLMVIDRARRRLRAHLERLGP